MNRRNPVHRTHRLRRAQRGVVLIIALIMLAIISLLAALSIRNATSGEAVSGNVRTTELATQAAEIALRFCEDQVVSWVSGHTVTSATFTITVPSGGGSLKVIANGSTDPFDVTKWDGNPDTVTYAVPLSEVNQPAPAKQTFLRGPECLAEHLPVVNSTKTAMDYTSTYRITSRGFGPEVAADASRGRPTGSEVWLQSTITITTP